MLVQVGIVVQISWHVPHDAILLGCMFVVIMFVGTSGYAQFQKDFGPVGGHDRFGA